MKSLEKQQRKISGFTIFIIVLVGILVAGLIAAGILLSKNSIQKQLEGIEASDFLLPEQEQRKTDKTPSNPVPTLTPRPEDRKLPELDGKTSIEISGDFNPIPTIFEAISPSVVGVLQYRTETYGKKDMLDVYATGSGFIASSSGYILTNAHLLEGAEKMTVMLADGEEMEATVIGSDNDTDVAVLKIDKKDLVPLAIGNSDNVRVGDFVLAIGNPVSIETLSNTLTFGIISAKSREITIEGRTNTYLQTDAAINYGNSGGPLLNLNGEVIGMNSAKTVNAGYDAFGNPVSAEGIGFALPINNVIEIMEKLIVNGSIERPAIGISVVTVTDMLAAQYEIPKGAYVSSVVKGGPASEAGVLAGDVIVAANGIKIEDKDILIDEINKLSIGDRLLLEIIRNGEEVQIEIQLGNKTGMDYDDVDPMPEPTETPIPTV